MNLLPVVILFLQSANAIDNLCPTLRGRDGRDGITGRDGISIAGPAGRDGRDGTDGQDCVECAKGPIGQKGPPGINGIDGIQGIQGIQGQKGNTGQHGVKGEKGDKGVCDAKVLTKLLSDIDALQKNQLALQQQTNVQKQQITNLNNENKKLQNLLLLVDGNNKIKQSYLPAGYDKYSLYDIQWQSLHMAAAAACRGSTPTGGNGSFENYVYPRSKGTSCKTVCSETASKYCDAEVSLHGFINKATLSKTRQFFGYFYNYGCDTTYTWGDEFAATNESIVQSIPYPSYCCCRR